MIKNSKIKGQNYEKLKTMNREILFLIILILVATTAFYVGMKYQQSKMPQGVFFQGGGQTAQARERMLSGEVISKDEKSLTLKLPNGSIRIIFLSEKTEFLKMTEGNLNDIEAGKQIMIIGNQTTEGAFVAEQIQLSPRIIPRR